MSIKDKIARGIISIVQKDINRFRTFSKSGKNLYDITASDDGYYLQETDGVLKASTGYIASDCIKVDAGITYTISSVRKFVFYDIDKVYVSGLNQTQAAYTFTALSDGYIRFSYWGSIAPNQQMEVGGAATTYQPFGYVSYNTEVYGKTILDLGDSIADGANSGGVGYADIVALKNNMTVYNYAVSGATIGDYTATEPTRSCIQNQLSDFITDHEGVVPDYVLVEGYANDINLITLGTKTSGYTDAWDASTFCGGLESIFNNLKTIFPSSKVLFIAVHNMSSRDATIQKSFHDTSVGICKKWSVPVVDLYEEGGLNTNISIMETTYTDTGTHPTLEGYELFYVPMIEAKMKSL